MPSVLMLHIARCTLIKERICNRDAGLHSLPMRRLQALSRSCQLCASLMLLNTLLQVAYVFVERFLDWLILVAALPTACLHTHSPINV